MPSLTRYLHTIRHLRPIQIYGRIWHRIYHPAADTRPAPSLRRSAMRWPGPCLRPPSLLAAGMVRLLGDERMIATAGDWQHAHPAALWLYNLHYFEDLNASEDPKRAPWQRALIERWLRDNPPAAGVGWDPYPISLRIVSWIRWLLRGNPPLPGMVESLAVQTRYLRGRLEHHLLGNHLFVNAKALVVAGSFFEGAEADAWRAEGHRLLARELDEQILDDGGHFERSPMYHALILEDVFDLLALERVFPGTSALTSALTRTATQMAHWLAAMTHPDGEIALFNDATLGVAASPTALLDYAASLGIARRARVGSVLDLEATGYTRVERAGAVLFTDTGAIGPDYLPGHAHADTLSFELSIGGRRILVDSGVSEYGTSAERVRQRGTAAHNTIAVDGEDSSEVWGGFRVARRARVRDRRVAEDGGRVSIHAAHDGYHRLAGRVTHARTWSMEDGALSITDDVTGGGRHGVEIFFHFGRDVVPVRDDGMRWSVAPEIDIEVDPRLSWELRAGTIHPAMGVREAAWVLVGSVVTRLPLRLISQIVWRDAPTR